MTDRVIAAKMEAGRRRSQLMGTLHQLQSRLAPKTLARDAWEGAKSKSAGLAEDAVDAVKKRPVAAGGIVAAVALFLARGPLMDIAHRLTGSGGEEDAEETQNEQLETEIMP